MYVRIVAIVPVVTDLAVSWLHSEISAFVYLFDQSEGRVLSVYCRRLALLEGLSLRCAIVVCMRPYVAVASHCYTCAENFQW